jgi:hypothetical protein
MDARPVMIVTSLDDPTADLVIGELNERGVPVVRVDSGDFPATLSASARIGTGIGWQGSLVTRNRNATLEGIRALYYRRPSGFAFPHLDPQNARFAVAQARYGLGGVLASLPGCLYINHPNRIGDAEFKPAGLATAAEVGLAVPATLITNVPEDARAFIKEHDRVLYKPLQVQPYTVDGVMPRGFSFPRGAELPPWMQLGARTELWVPAAFTAEEIRSQAENLAVGDTFTLDKKLEPTTWTVARRTVSSMSRNLRSTKTRWPRLIARRIISGPAVV